jgi:hypothetical protein
VPPLILAGATAALKRGRRDGWGGVGRQAALAGLVALVAAAAVAAAALTNRAYYGTTQVVEFKQPEFLAGYGALMRVRAGPALPYVAISHAAMAQAAAVSPTFAGLLPQIDSDEGRMIAKEGCRVHGISPCDGEIRSGWFLWVLRDAVATAGGYRDARTAKAFYRQLAAEIDAACDDGRLQCLPPRHTMAPPFAWRSLRTALGTAVAMTRFMIVLDGVGTLDAPVSCLASHPGSPCASYAAFFDELATPLFVMPTFLLGPQGQQDYARWQAEDASLLSVRLAAVALRSFVMIHGIYRVGLPWWFLAAGGCFVLAVALRLRRRPQEDAFAAATFCLLLVASRVGLLAYLDTVAMPAMNVQYLSPAYPFLLLFCVLAPVSLARTLLAPSNGRRAPAERPTNRPSGNPNQ